MARRGYVLYQLLHSRSRSCGEVEDVSGNLVARKIVLHIGSRWPLGLVPMVREVARQLVESALPLLASNISQMIILLAEVKARRIIPLLS